MSPSFWQKIAALLAVTLVVLVAVVVWSIGSRPSVLIASQGSSPSGVTLGILTQGSATVSKQPDIAFISVGVQAQETTASAAQTSLATQANQLIAQAHTLGMADKDINTAGYSLYPSYTSPDYTHVTGYSASEQLNLKWHDVNTVGKALDALVQQGGASRVSASFGLADPKVAQSEARTLAIADARATAQVMASAAGVKVGPILRISDLSTSSGLLPSLALGADKTTQLPIGAIDVSVSVEVDFAIAS